MIITRAEIEELRRRVAEARSRSRSRARIAIMARLGELHEHLALMVRYLEEETSQGDGIAEQHWDGYQGAKSVLARTAPDQPQWENAQIEISVLLAKASEVPGLSATLDEVRGERDRLRALLAECKSALGPVPGWPESSTARELRARIEAELLGPGHPAPDREPDEQQQGERDERLGPGVDGSDER